MDAMQHAIILNSLQNDERDEELKPLSMEPAEEYIDGIPLSIKRNSLENYLTVALEKQKNKLESLRAGNLPDRGEKIYVTKRNIELICKLRQITIMDSIDYEFVNYCYNSGRFRTPEEVQNKEAEIKQIRENIRISNIRKSPEYNKHYHPFLFYCAWFFGLPCIIGIWWEGSWGIIAGVFIWAWAFIPFAIIAAIATWIYCSCHASNHDVPMDDKEALAIIGGTAVGCALHYRDRKRINKQYSPKNRKKITVVKDTAYVGDILYDLF